MEKIDWEKMQELVKEETQFEKEIKKIIKASLPTVLTIMFLIYVYLWIMGHYGFERPVISLLVIIVVLLHDILRAVKDAVR